MTGTASATGDNLSAGDADMDTDVTTDTVITKEEGFGPMAPLYRI